MTPKGAFKHLVSEAQKNWPQISDEIDQLKSFNAALRSRPLPMTRESIIHGDFHSDNIVTDWQEKPVGLIDFEYSRKTSVSDEFAALQPMRAASLTTFIRSYSATCGITIEPMDVALGQILHAAHVMTLLPVKMDARLIGKRLNILMENAAAFRR